MQGGFHPPPGWAAIPPEGALAFVARALSSGTAAGPRTLTRVEAEALAVRVRSLFSAQARYFTTGEANREAAADAGVESSLFVIDGDRAGLFWVEREG